MIDTNQIVEALLRLERGICRESNRFARAGIRDFGPTSIIGNYQLLSLAMDIIGYPPDTSDDDKSSCRDWAVDEFEEIAKKKDEESITAFARRLRQVMAQNG